MRLLSIGVDFGTSNTVIAVVDEQRRASVLSFASRAESSSALPSILCFRPTESNPRERPISSAGVDAIADYLARTGPARLIQPMKSFLGSKSFIDTRVFTHVYSLEEIIGVLDRRTRRQSLGIWNALNQKNEGIADLSADEETSSRPATARSHEARKHSALSQYRSGRRVGGCRAD